MSRATSERVPKPRRRRLSIVYFVDAARTRTFSMPLSLALVGLGALLVVVGWSATSAALLVWQGLKAEEQGQSLRQALATIFEYEVQNDDVFDRAYPATAKPGAVPVPPPAPKSPAAALTAKTPPPKPAVAQPPAAASPVHVAANATAVPPAKPAPSPAVAGHAATATDPANAASSRHSADGVEVTGARVEATAKGLVVRFDLSNAGEQDRAEGLLLAVAAFKSDKGDVRFYGAPHGVQVDASGVPTEPLKAMGFAIKRFKQKSLTLPLPPGEHGEFTAVDIIIMDVDGHQETKVHVPVQIRVGRSGVPILPGAPATAG